MSGDEEVDGQSIFSIAERLAAIERRLHQGGLTGANLAEIEIGGRTLAQYMTEMTDLSSYGLAWRRLMGRVPKGLPPRLVEDLEQVIAGQHGSSGRCKSSFGGM